MATSQMGKVIHQLHKVLLRQDAATLTDGELLEAFLKRNDAAALETLIRRCGPMVWCACRRILRHDCDAEDAFQATFLVLLRRAHSIVPRAMVRGWLYGVANKTALKARATSNKRKERERQANEMSEPAVSDQEVQSDWQPLLDREICALPEKYRVVLLLCDLDGKTRKEAARQLGWPEGTVAGRLAKARSMLAKRLARHGLAVTGSTLIAALAENAASASMPVSVLAATIQTTYLVSTGQAATNAVSAQVAALTEGVMKTMLLSKLKGIATAMLFASMIVLGGGLLAQQANTGERSQAEPLPTHNAEAPPGKSPRNQPAPWPIRITYPVADLVIPIHGLDINRAEYTKPAADQRPHIMKAGNIDVKGTKEDWLIRKIMRTVAPKTWEGQGGDGKIVYEPISSTLLVKNSPQIQNGVRHLLETMRRVQDVQVCLEMKMVSIRKGFFPKLQDTFPDLKKGGHLILNEAELLAMQTKSQSDRATTIVHLPKITMFAGQRAAIGNDKDVINVMALIAGNMHHIHLELNGKVGAMHWAKSTRLTEGATLVLAADADGDRTMLLLATPRIIIASEEIALAEPVVIQAEATKKNLHPGLSMPSKEYQLAQALMEYERACEAKDLVRARRCAVTAIEIDPACFQKMRDR